MDSQIVCVKLYGSEKVYDFKNDHDFPVKVGSKVVVKVGTGGTTEGVVVGFGKLNKNISYKRIVEVHKLKVKQEPLQDGNEYVCDIRIWREQWSSDGGYKEQWSDLIRTCLYDSSQNVTIGSIVIYGDTEGKVVNLRQIPKKKTLIMERVKLKEANHEKKKGFIARLFGL